MFSNICGFSVAWFHLAPWHICTQSNIRSWWWRMDLGRTNESWGLRGRRVVCSMAVEVHLRKMGCRNLVRVIFPWSKPQLNLCHVVSSTLTEISCWSRPQKFCQPGWNQRIQRIGYACHRQVNCKSIVVHILFIHRSGSTVLVSISFLSYTCLHPLGSVAAANCLVSTRSKT